MCRAQVEARGSATRTSGTSSFMAVHASTAKTSSFAGGCCSPGEVELFPPSSLSVALGISTGRGLPESSFLLFLANDDGDTEG